MSYRERRDLTKYDNGTFCSMCRAIFAVYGLPPEPEHLSKILQAMHGDVTVHAIGTGLDAFSTETILYAGLEELKGASFFYHFALSNRDYEVCTD